MVVNNQTVRDSHEDLHHVTTCLHHNKKAYETKSGANSNSKNTNKDIVQELQETNGMQQSAFSLVRSLGKKMSGFVQGIWNESGKSDNKQSEICPSDSMIEEVNENIIPDIKIDKGADTQAVISKRKRLAKKTDTAAMPNDKDSNKKSRFQATEQLKKIKRKIQNHLFLKIEKREKFLKNEELKKKDGKEYLLDSYDKEGEFKSKTFSSFDSYS